MLSVRFLPCKLPLSPPLYRVSLSEQASSWPLFLYNALTASRLILIMTWKALCGWYLLPVDFPSDDSPWLSHPVSAPGALLVLSRLKHALTSGHLSGAHTPLLLGLQDSLPCSSSGLCICCSASVPLYSSALCLPFPRPFAPPSKASSL